MEEQKKFVVDVLEVHSKRYEVTESEYKWLCDKYDKDNVIIVESEGKQ
jgi:hypothetical protein